MHIVNLTPHSLTILAGDDSRTFPSSGVARVAETRTQVGEVDGIPVHVVERSEVTGLPEPAEGTVYVVSEVTARAVPGRTDVFSPGELDRDDAGRIMGCRGLSRWTDTDAWAELAQRLPDSWTITGRAISHGVDDGAPADIRATVYTLQGVDENGWPWEARHNADHVEGAWAFEIGHGYDGDGEVVMRRGHSYDPEEALSMCLAPAGGE